MVLETEVRAESTLLKWDGESDGECSTEADNESAEFLPHPCYGICKAISMM